jgi:hypothetical protein
MTDEDNATPETNQSSDNTNVPLPIPSQNEQVLPKTEPNPSDKHVHVTMNIPNKHWTVDWLPIVVNAALAVIGVIAIFVYGAQLGVMRGQLVAMNKQLCEIQRQTTLAQQQLEGTMAAILKINTGVDTDRKMFEINLMNVGHVIARQVHVTLQITKRTLPSEGPIGVSIPVDFMIPEIGLAQDKWTERQYPVALSPSEVKAIFDTELTVRVEGNITYNNGFESVPQSICYAYLAYEIRDKTGKVTLGGNNPSVPCDEYDEMLRNILRQKKETIQK